MLLGVLSLVHVSIYLFNTVLVLAGSGFCYKTFQKTCLFVLVRVLACMGFSKQLIGPKPNFFNFWALMR